MCVVWREIPLLEKVFNIHEILVLILPKMLLYRFARNPASRKDLIEISMRSFQQIVSCRLREIPLLGKISNKFPVLLKISELKSWKRSQKRPEYG